MKAIENRGRLKGTLVSPYTQACVKYLRTYGPSTLAQLGGMIERMDKWAKDLQSIQTDSPTRLLRLLHKLQGAGHVHRVLRDDAILWAPGPHPQAVEPAAEVVPDAAPYVAAVVQSPCFDRMHGALYVPDAAPTLRPGAMDYKRCPTVGLRC